MCDMPTSASNTEFVAISQNAQLIHSTPTAMNTRAANLPRLMSAAACFSEIISGISRRMASRMLRHTSGDSSGRIPIWQPTIRNAAASIGRNTRGTAIVPFFGAVRARKQSAISPTAYSTSATVSSAGTKCATSAAARSPHAA